MTRHEVIDSLIQYLTNGNDSSRTFADVLREGCRGYDDFTNKELASEYLSRFDEEVVIEEEPK